MKGFKVIEAIDFNKEPDKLLKQFIKRIKLMQVSLSTQIVLAEISAITYDENEDEKTERRKDNLILGMFKELLNFATELSPHIEPEIVQAKIDELGCLDTKPCKKGTNVEYKISTLVNFMHSFCEREGLEYSILVNSKDNGRIKRIETNIENKKNMTAQLKSALNQLEKEVADAD